MSTTPEIVTDLRTYFRQSAAGDAVAIRTSKERVRSEQRALSPHAAGLQSRLARLRREARARHVTYSLWKGRCWAEIENNRPDGDPFLSQAIAKAWADAVSATGGTASPPEGLRLHIARWL